MEHQHMQAEVNTAERKYPWIQEILEKDDRKYMKPKQNISSALNQNPSIQQQYYNLMKSYEENKEWQI